MTNEQGELFAARVARDRAVQQVGDNADATWKFRAELVLDSLIASGNPFTSDDVWSRLDCPREPRALGAIILAASKAHRIRRIGFRTSTKGINHARPVAVWQGIL